MKGMKFTPGIGWHAVDSHIKPMVKRCRRNGKPGTFIAAVRHTGTNPAFILRDPR